MTKIHKYRLKWVEAQMKELQKDIPMPTVLNIGVNSSATPIQITLVELRTPLSEDTHPPG